MDEWVGRHLVVAAVVVGLTDGVLVVVDVVLALVLLRGCSDVAKMRK